MGMSSLRAALARELEADGLVADVDAALGQKILDAAQGSEYRTYIMTARRMTSGELLKYRNGFFIRRT
jgi:hypothetical protein